MTIRQIVIFFIVCFLIGTGVNRICKGYSFPISPVTKYPVKDLLNWMIRDKQMRSRLWFTIGALIVLQFVFMIPLPGIDIEVLKNFFSRISQNRGGSTLITTLVMFSGPFRRVTIFGLGLAPFLSSCLCIQFASIFIPKLRCLLFGGERERDKIVKYGLYLTIFLSIAYSHLISRWLENPAYHEGIRIVTMYGWGFRTLVIVTMTASVFILLFIANMINRYGIGNGIAMVVISVLPLEALSAFSQLSLMQKEGRLVSAAFLLLSLFFVIFIYLVLYVTGREKEIELQNDDRTQKTSFHLRTTWVALQPIGWATVTIFFLATVTSLTPTLQKLVPWLAKDGWLNLILLGGFIFIFTYLYAWIVFKSRYVSKLMDKYGYSLTNPEVKKIEDYLDDSVSKILIITGLFLTAVAILPALIMNFFKIPYFVSLFTGQAGVLVAVGIYFDLIKQLEFFKEKSEFDTKKWSICYVAFDEIEAKIKSGYLKNRGIPSLIEPLRFTWGMPIRTAVDQYRIYVPEDKREEARKKLT